MDLIAAVEAKEEFDKEMNKPGGYREVINIDDGVLNYFSLDLHAGVSSNSIPELYLPGKTSGG